MLISFLFNKMYFSTWVLLHYQYLDWVATLSFFLVLCSGWPCLYGFRKKKIGDKTALIEYWFLYREFKDCLNVGKKVLILNIHNIWFTFSYIHNIGFATSVKKITLLLLTGLAYIHLQNALHYEFLICPFSFSLKSSTNEVFEKADWLMDVHFVGSIKDSYSLLVSRTPYSYLGHINDRLNHNTNV